MVDWVRYTSILCNTLIIEINLSISCYCNILKKSISLDCIKYIRLRLLIKSDNLCITSALEVKDSVVIPTVLIITDK